MWSDNKALHEECVAHIRKIARIEKKEERYVTALDQITVLSATMPRFPRQSDFFSLMAQAALYPNDYRKD